MLLKCQQYQQGLLLLISFRAQDLWVIMHFSDPSSSPIAMTLTYIDLDILLSDLWKVLAVAHYLLKL